MRIRDTDVYRAMIAAIMVRRALKELGLNWTADIKQLSEMIL